MADSTVTLGDVTFDPLSVQDFRLSVEGNSGFGKSNTLSVILEDLADVAVPTLIVERVGALSTVRLEDENIVVVGARDDEHVDLAVALDDLDMVGEWVLDRGMKVLLDVSTYEDYESDESRTHEAAFRAIRSLNDRAHEKYNAGDRTKSLLVVDEAHYMAPENGAPEPTMDESVRRCRGQIIKATTEGGNKGISAILSFQRRAYLSKGAISLCSDWITHQPPNEDADRTAKALRCDEGTLAGLDVGEIVARGEDITDGDLVGPTKVRKRHSPDPRDETFELPETTAEMAEVLDDIQSQVEAEREKRSERQDELEQLREENERLREQKAELEEELANVDSLSSALERVAGTNGNDAVAEVGEGAEALQQRVDELREERDALEDRVDELLDEREDVREERDRLDERVADLDSELQELRAAHEEARDAVRTLTDAFAVDAAVASPSAGDEPQGSDAENGLRERVEELEAENERLRAQVGGEISEKLETYEDFLDLDVVREEIRDAAGEASSGPAVRGIIASIVDERGPVTYEEVARRIDHTSTSHVSPAAKELASRGIVEKEKKDDGKIHVDLNTDGIAEIRQHRADRERTQELMERFE